MNTDFVVMFDCVGRPRGLRRVLLDLVCGLTGHLLWRSMHSTVPNPTGSLPYYGVHCKRCFRGGFVQGDYR